MITDPGPRRDDRVRGYTRALSLGVFPFLVVGFVVLYVFPDRTATLFAWPIQPTMTSMVLASAYLGGAYFFARVLWESRWHVVRTGFGAVCLFASLLGVATLLHWDRFSHDHVAFWLWSGLYFTTPFLVLACLVANQRHAAPAEPGDLRVGGITRVIISAVGLLALVQGVVMFVAPAQMIDQWPWTLTPLTCRVMGAVLCLGAAGVGVMIDPRWSALRLMLQVEMVMISLILIAAVRARGQFDTDRPLTWLMLVGMVGVLIGSAVLWYAMEIKARREARF